MQTPLRFGGRLDVVHAGGGLFGAAHDLGARVGQLAHQDGAETGLRLQHVVVVVVRGLRFSLHHAAAVVGAGRRRRRPPDLVQLGLKPAALQLGRGVVPRPLRLDPLPELGGRVSMLWRWQLAGELWWIAPMSSSFVAAALASEGSFSNSASFSHADLKR